MWEGITEKKKLPFGTIIVLLVAVLVPACILSTTLGRSPISIRELRGITWDQVKTIAESKMPDLNAFTLKSAMTMVAGTARSMGIKVEGEFPADI